MHCSRRELWFWMCFARRQKLRLRRSPAGSKVFASVASACWDFTLADRESQFFDPQPALKSITDSFFLNIAAGAPPAAFAAVRLSASMSSFTHPTVLISTLPLG